MARNSPKTKDRRKMRSKRKKENASNVTCKSVKFKRKEKNIWPRNISKKVSEDNEPHGKIICDRLTAPQKKLMRSGLFLKGKISEVSRKGGAHLNSLNEARMNEKVCDIIKLANKPDYSVQRDLLPCYEVCSGPETYASEKPSYCSRSQPSSLPINMQQKRENDMILKHSITFRDEDDVIMKTSVDIVKETRHPNRCYKTEREFSDADYIEYRAFTQSFDIISLRRRKKKDFIDREKKKIARKMRINQCGNGKNTASSNSFQTRKECLKSVSCSPIETKDGIKKEPKLEKTKENFNHLPFQELARKKIASTAEEFSDPVVDNCSQSSGGIGLREKSRSFSKKEHKLKKIKKEKENFNNLPFQELDRKIIASTAGGQAEEFSDPVDVNSSQSSGGIDLRETSRSFSKKEHKLKKIKKEKENFYNLPFQEFVQKIIASAAGGQAEEFSDPVDVNSSQSSGGIDLRETSRSFSKKEHKLKKIKKEKENFYNLPFQEFVQKIIASAAGGQAEEFSDPVDVNSSQSSGGIDLRETSRSFSKKEHKLKKIKKEKENFYNLPFQEFVQKIIASAAGGQAEEFSDPVDVNSSQSSGGIDLRETSRSFSKKEHKLKKIKKEKENFNNLPFQELAQKIIASTAGGQAEEFSDPVDVNSSQSSGGIDLRETSRSFSKKEHKLKKIKKEKENFNNLPFQELAQKIIASTAGGQAEEFSDPVDVNSSQSSGGIDLRETSRSFSKKEHKLKKIKKEKENFNNLPFQEFVQKIIASAAGGQAEEFSDPVDVNSSQSSDRTSTASESSPFFSDAAVFRSDLFNIPPTEGTSLDPVNVLKNTFRCDNLLKIVTYNESGFHEEVLESSESQVHEKYSSPESSLNFVDENSNKTYHYCNENNMFQSAHSSVYDATGKGRKTVLEKLSTLTRYQKNEFPSDSPFLDPAGKLNQETNRNSLLGYHKDARAEHHYHFSPLKPSEENAPLIRKLYQQTLPNLLPVPCGFEETQPEVTSSKEDNLWQRRRMF